MHTSPAIADILSPRLILRHLTPDMLRASMEARLAEVATALGSAVPLDWLEEAAVMSLRLDQMENEPEYAPWSMRAMLLRETGQLVGHINFHTCPGHAYLKGRGDVELGYTVLSAFRRQGFATEALLACADWAVCTAGVKRFVLSISPDNLPSQQLAARLGFRWLERVEDPDDGPEDVLVADWPFQQDHA
ncbi:GNAT family N-acetyltransferase [Aquitalea sp. LB_tupeE]|uniref:GNAT family N-acetyltransferase n=1 Tax=Aquitalea sp. LB_tupeE TaxID=2748078 RepID=UPI0015B7BA6D|nr:GNAT family protein [Aquitalea sp. LB_tupeE]NWK78958.1 GNAT family N-acetyltransferase [Aquitalea sp. LB_tupeE]